MEEILFYERQYFRQVWLWLIMAGLTALMAWGLISQIILDIPFGNNPGPDWMLFLSFGLVAALDLLLLTLSLEFRVYKSSLEYRFFPFIGWKNIGWHQVDKVYVREYRPVAEYGGWGIRFQPGRRSRALNVSGRIGLQIIYKDGSRLLIGTQRPHEIEDILVRTDSPYADIDWPGK